MSTLYHVHRGINSTDLMKFCHLFILKCQGVPVRTVDVKNDAALYELRYDLMVNCGRLILGISLSRVGVRGEYTRSNS